MIRLRFGTFLCLSTLGFAINFPFLIRNLVLLQFSSKQTLELHVQDCSVTKRVISCTTAGIQNVIFPFLFWILGIKCKIKLVPNLDCHYT